MSLRVLFRVLPWLVCLATATAQTPWPADASSYRFHMIGNAHIDPVWLWPWPEGLSVVHSTFRSALERMKETPGFAFTASSAAFYEWVAESDPEMLAEVRRRVEEGRWAIVGGWWVEPDCNIPSGESFARHGLYSQRLFQRLFGRRARVAYNPDSFGHAGTLPQIFKQQGMEAYVFMRPEEHEKKLPAHLFWWEGPDGTRLLTFRIPYSYVDRGPVNQRLRRIVAERKEPTRTLMGFYGAGDHGGGATRENIASILALEKQAGAPRVLFSTPEKYFGEVRNTANLPVVREDLQHHAVGCYTTLGEMKKNNRKAESWLQAAEKWAALGAAVAGLGYPRQEFAAAWKKVLFQQFHDIMGGTSLPEHDAEARHAHGYALEVASQALHRAAQAIAAKAPATDPDSQYLVVFNPHVWTATLPVEYDLDWPMRLPGGDRARETYSVLEDDSGRVVAHQWTQGSTVTGARTKLVFQAEVPAFGYRQYRLRRVAEAPGAPGPVALTGRSLENEHLRATFDSAGGLSLLDKDSNRELFRSPGARAVVLDDPSDTWSHAVRDYSTELGAFGNAGFLPLESGPVRAVLRVRTSFGNSSLTQDWLLYKGARRLECRVRLDWHERLRMMKFSFPVAVNDPVATYEIAYGHIVRATGGAEDPGQRWVDVSGPDYGFTLLNDAKYGYSVPGADLRLSVVRSPVYAHHDPRRLETGREYLYQDQGEQSFRMWLVPHTGPWQEAGVVRLAEELHLPAPVIYQGVHAGRRPAAAGFLAVNVPNVVVSVLKKAEDGEDYILRAYETAGRATEATLDLAFLKRKWSGKFRASEIKTLRIPQTGPIREVNLLEE